MPTAPFASYVVRTSPHSGSTLLCGLLAASDSAGQPDPPFHAPPLGRWLEVYGLADHIAALTALDDAWNGWFARKGIEALRIAYAELATTPRSTLARMLDALGLDPERAASVTMPTAKLGDAISAEWRERYLSERKED